MGGLGKSWAVPIYVLNGNFPDEFPGEEDLVPFDGEPHPEFGPLAIGANPVFPDWQGEHQGADIDHGAHGGNPHPNLAQHGILHPQGEASPAANTDGWQAWESVNVNVHGNENQAQSQRLK